MQGASGAGRIDMISLIHFALILDRPLPFSSPSRGRKGREESKRGQRNSQNGSAIGCLARGGDSLWAISGTGRTICQQNQK
jgi:hypothetical protein